MCAFLPAPLSCGSPDLQLNTTVIGRNYSSGGVIEYQCQKGHSLIGEGKRTCQKNGVWSSIAPTCKCKWNINLN